MFINVAHLHQNLNDILIFVLSGSEQSGIKKVFDFASNAVNN